MNPQELSDQIIDFELKHEVSDNDLAFASHLSVEKIHAMKTGENLPGAGDINQLLDYIHANM